MVKKSEFKQLAAPTSPFSLHYQNTIEQNVGCHSMASNWLVVPHQPHRSLIMQLYYLSKLVVEAGYFLRSCSHVPW